jgi:hypothetical protein
MDGRTGDSGAVLPSRDVAVTVPNVTAGATGDVANALTDLAFATGVGGPRYSIAIELIDTPIANMGAFYAWVADVATGQISVRFVAGTGNIATAAKNFRIRRTA